MQELIILFLIAFFVIGSLLWKSSYSFDEIEQENEKTEMPSDYIHNSWRYNIKYHEKQPIYRDPHFGSASGGNKVNQFIL